MYYECSGRKFSGKNNHGKGIAALSYEKILSLHISQKTQRLFFATGVLQKFTKVHRNSPVPEKVHLL